MLTRHPASNWVDSEFDVLALLPQEGDHLGNGVLALGNSETISRHNHDVPGVTDGLDGLVDLPDGGGSSDSHGLTSSSAGGSETTENDIRKGSVHGDAHDVGEDGTAGANQAADHSHQVVVQHEALSAESPSGVGVEDSDDNRHVSATNGHSEGDSHHAGEGGSSAKHAKTHTKLRGHEEVAHGAGVSGQKATVDGVSARQHQRVGVQVAIELAIGDEGPSEGDTTDVGSEEEGGLDHGGGGVGGKAGVVIQVGGEAGEHGSHADQRVEGSDQLGQVSDLDLLGDASAKNTTGASANCHLGEHLRAGLEKTESGGNTAGHTDHAKSVSEPGGGLRRETSKGTNASKAGGEVGHLVHLGVALGHGIAVSAKEGGSGNAHQHGVLWGVGGALEHVQHALGHNEASEDVDEGDEGSASGQRLDGVGGVETTSHEEHSTNSCDSRDGVGDGHEGRVQGGDDAPHGVVADNAAEREGGGHVGEGGVGGANSKGVDCSKSSCVAQGSLHLLIEVVHLDRSSSRGGGSSTTLRSSSSHRDWWVWWPGGHALVQHD